MRPRLAYLAISLLAGATLILEILLTRIVSVVAWYHLAFFVISLSMLGMTAGAVFVFVRTSERPLHQRLVRATLGFSLSSPLVLWLVMAIPLMPVRSVIDLAALVLWGGLLAIPFGFAGVTLTLALTRAPLPPSRAYGADLIGAACGCASVIVLLKYVDAATGAIIAAALGSVAAALFAKAARVRARAPWGLTLVLTLCALANALSPAPPLRPGWVKGMREDPAVFALTRWNTHSRVTVSHPVPIPPMVWARGRNAPQDLFTPIVQRQILIDGAAATFITAEGGNLDKHEWIDWDISSFAHRLRPSGATAVIGVGGGRDIIAAARAGHELIVGLELNEDIVELHRGVLREEGGILDIPGVELHAAEARRFLTDDTRAYSVIAMSLIDTWASTGAGAYSLSESGLYTVEAWQTFLRRLEPDGIFTVSRWYLPTAPGETARMLVLAFETLYQLGVKDPRAHLILLQNDAVATLLVSPQPFSKGDLDAMQAGAVKLGFNMIATPRKPPSGGLLATIWGLEDASALRVWSSAQALDLTAPTDNRPFFFQMLKPSTWIAQREHFESLDLPILGNLHATQTLAWATVVSFLLATLGIFAPLAYKRRSLANATSPSAAVKDAGLYFGLIGTGFMFVEIGLLSRLDVLLGDPVRALALLLGGIILGAGIGSLASARLSLEPRSARSWLFPVLPCLAIVGAIILSNAAGSEFINRGAVARSLAAFLLVFLPGAGMGICFPLGLRLAGAHGEHDSIGPWLWGINGATGVCASSLALASTMVWGISTTLWIGALCYVALLVPARRMALGRSGPGTALDPQPHPSRG